MTIIVNFDCKVSKKINTLLTRSASPITVAIALWLKNA